MIVHLCIVYSSACSNYTSNHSYRTEGLCSLQSKAVKTWERLCLKVLEQEYARLEQEIKTKQSLHLRNRELYMEEILNTHQDDMSRIPFHRNTSLQSVDTEGQFLHVNQTQNAKVRLI